jgi:hypothetical protein
MFHRTPHSWRCFRGRIAVNGGHLIVPWSRRDGEIAAYRGAPSSPAVDLWALSVIMLEAVSGVNPFSTTHREARFRGAAAVSIPELGSQHFRAVPSLRAFLETRAGGGAGAEISIQSGVSGRARVRGRRTRRRIVNSARRTTNAVPDANAQKTRRKPSCVCLGKLI